MDVTFHFVHCIKNISFFIEFHQSLIKFYRNLLQMVHLLSVVQKMAWRGAGKMYVFICSDAYMLNPTSMILTSSGESILRSMSPGVEENLASVCVCFTITMT